MIRLARFDLTDAQTGARVPDADVWLLTDAGSWVGQASSGADGQANFYVDDGAYVLHWRKVGYVDGELGVLIDRDTEIAPLATPGRSTAHPPGGSGVAGGRGPSIDYGPIPEPGPSTITVGPPDVVDRPAIGAVQYVTIDGVPHIRPEFFAPPEVGVSGGPYILIGILALDALASLFGGRGYSESTDTKQDREIRALRDGVLNMGLMLAAESFAALTRDGRGLGGQQGILGKVLGPVINAIATLFGAVHNSLLKWLGPAIKWINRLRDLVKRIYDVWLRPILAVIDTFRAFLKILEVFHVKWAQALDDKLALVERKLTAPILLIQSKLNEALNWINRIVTLDGALQRVALLKGLIDNADEAMNLFWTKLHHPITASRKAAYLTPVAALPVDGAVSTIRSYLVDGSGADAARIDEAAQDLQIRLAHVP